MKKHEPLSSAKAVLGLMVLGIAAVMFYQFSANQELLFNDPKLLRNYVIFAILGGGFLIGLLYLGSHTTHSSASKSSKSKKKKK